MKRRSFIKKSLGAAAIPVFLNGLPVRMFADQFSKMAALSTNDRVVVMVQLMGGNDGLNTLVPIDQYDTYLEYRPKIAIPDQGERKYILLNDTHPSEKHLGLHPEMTHLKEMYDNNLVTVIQNVAYENPDMSHFRGRDIMFMGGGSDDYWHSGWMGRYLDKTYEGYPEDYPNDEMPDPLGLEFGFNMSLIFQREEGIPAGLAIIDPVTFHQLITGGGVAPPDWLPDSYYGDEMQYLMDLELKSNQYAERIKEVYENGINSPNVEYPEIYPGEVDPNYKKNDLAWQLQTVARLISGGSKTKTFLVKLNGFDTHADQVLQGEPTHGIHAALLYHLSSAMKAFYDDLKDQGLDERVVTVTTSEFGRRVYDNASYGTDHGTSAPQFAFGPMLKHQVFGSPPNLSDLTDGNLKYEYDYRQIYTSILVDWLETPADIVEEVRWTDFVESRLPLFNLYENIDENRGSGGIAELTIYPNPAREKTNIKFKLNKPSHVDLSIYDLNGRKVMSVYHGVKTNGEHHFQVTINNFKTGNYLIRLQNGMKVMSKKLLVQ